MSNTILLEKLSKPFLSVTDIQEILGNCSLSKVTRIRKKIKEFIAPKQLLTQDTPTSLFIEIMSIDIDFIRKQVKEV